VLAIREGFMKNSPVNSNDMAARIDFSKGVRGLHHIPPGSKVLMPVPALTRPISRFRKSLCLHLFVKVRLRLG
jgi:hypothetical protein